MSRHARIANDRSRCRTTTHDNRLRGRTSSHSFSRKGKDNFRRLVAARDAADDREPVRPIRKATEPVFRLGFNGKARLLPDYV
jgi:hypothetical protein